MWLLAESVQVQVYDFPVMLYPPTPPLSLYFGCLSCSALVSTPDYVIKFVDLQSVAINL